MKIVVKSLEKGLARSKPSAKLTLLFYCIRVPAISIHLPCVISAFTTFRQSLINKPMFAEDPKALRRGVICPQSPSQL